MRLLDDEVVATLERVRNIVERIVFRRERFLDDVVQLVAEGDVADLTGMSFTGVLVSVERILNDQCLRDVLLLAPVLLAIDFVLGLVVVLRNLANGAVFTVHAQAWNGLLLTIDCEVVEHLFYQESTNVAFVTVGQEADDGTLTGLHVPEWVVVVCEGLAIGFLLLAAELGLECC